LVIDDAAARLTRFFEAAVELMQVLARACGHSHLNQFDIGDLTTFHREMSELTGIAYGGATP
ncbi:MAG: glutamate synthase, partial [Acidimicrobiia bacterium]|nr:glutamate synthase [Acidimicrobiia bacterium]